MDDLRADPLLARSTEVKGFKVLPPCVLFSRIGVGGMGAVYCGHHLNLDIEVAVKCLKPTLAEDDPTFVERFRREARAAARINHQNVVRVFDVAESMGLHYLIMEFVQGETARQRVERKGPLDVSEALEIVYEASLGLGEAHRLGLVHRDIKPDNLLVSSRGQVKVADLGLAKPAVGTGTSMLSMAGQVLGTPPYMPPEQWGEGTVTAATDVWAMGAVLYFLLTSQEAIRGDSLANIMSRIVLQPFPDVRDFRQDVPDAVAELLQKATAKEPGQRFFDAGELADAIARLPEHRISLVDTDAGTTELRTMLSPPPMPQIEEIKALLRQGGTTRNQPAPGREAAPKEPETKPRAVARSTGERRGGRLLLPLVALLLVGGGGAFAYLQWGGDGKDQPVRPDPVNPEPPVAQLPTAEELEASLQREDVVAVQKGTASRFAGRFAQQRPARLRLGDEEVALRDDGSFEVERVVDGDTLAVTAILDDGDELALQPFAVTFVEPPPPPPPSAPTFVRDLSAVGQRIVDGNITDQDTVTVSGRATKGGVPVFVAGERVEDVTWVRETFTFDYALSAEGRNTIAVTLGSADGDRRTLDVVRLTKAPTLTPIAPAETNARTDATQITFEIRADEWTSSVRAQYGNSRLDFEQRDDVWVTKTPIPLDDGANTILVIGENATGKARELKFTVTSTAPIPQVGGVFVSFGEAEERRVEAGAKVFVNARPKLRVALADDVSLLVDGTTSPLTFEPKVANGEQRALELKAVRDRRSSPPFALTIVFDGTKPLLDAKQPEPVAPGAEVTLTGTWSDRYGIASLTVDGGGAEVNLSDERKPQGTWSLVTKAGDGDSRITIVATDMAGNVARKDVLVRVVATKPVEVEPDPQPVEPVALEPDELRFPGFTRINGTELDAQGYPKELKHDASGIELVALPAGGKAPLYVAKRVTSNREWDGDGDTEPVVSVTWLDVASKLREPRFAKLGLPTKAEWARIQAASNAKLVTGKTREWLAQSGDESFEQRPLFDGTAVRATKATFSGRYTSFRVVFRPN